LDVFPRSKTPANQEEKEENALAMFISKGIKQGGFSKEVESELEKWKNDDRKKQASDAERHRIEQLMADVRDFGRWPVQHVLSKDPEREAERLLAQRVGKMRAAACLAPCCNRRIGGSGSRTPC
jgi:hypothetical protein